MGPWIREGMKFRPLYSHGWLWLGLPMATYLKWEFPWDNLAQGGSQGGGASGPWLSLSGKIK